MKQAIYTTIVHKHLHESGLNVQEFFVADMIDKLSKPVCTMGRERMAEVAILSKSTLIRIIERLIELGYIVRDGRGLKSSFKWSELVDVEDGAQSVKMTPKQEEPKCQNDTQECQNDTLDSVKMTPYYNSNIDINIYNSTADQKGQQKPGLPESFGKSQGTRLVTLYRVLWLQAFDSVYSPNYGAFNKALKPLLDSYTEWQVAALLVCHFNWKGLNGDDDRISKNLEGAGFPIYWVGTNANQYMTFLVNVDEVIWEDADSLKKYVKEHIQDVLLSAKQKKIIS